MAILEVRGLVKYYGSRKVVDGVTFQVDVGEVVGLLGPNGAGKTTSFRMTTGQVTPNGGKVIFAGKDVTHLPMFGRARLGMGYLAQETSVFRKLTVEQNVMAILEIMPKHRVLGRKLTRAECLDRTEKVLDKFGLTHLRKNNAARLSGGEKRRLEIARCLACDPLLILLDEPFTGVDVKTEEAIITLLRELRAAGCIILVSTHNLGSVPEFCDQVVLINRTVLAYGPTSQVFTEQNLAAAFGGVLRQFHFDESTIQDHDGRAIRILTDDERPLIFGKDGHLEYKDRQEHEELVKQRTEEHE